MMDEKGKGKIIEKIKKMDISELVIRKEMGGNEWKNPEFFYLIVNELNKRLQKPEGIQIA